MSNTCPRFYCDSCGSDVHDNQQQIKSAYELGRAERQAELDAWHTGEPPENKQVLISTGDGCIVLGIRNGKNMWVDGLGIFRWDPEYKWREVRP